MSKSKKSKKQASVKKVKLAPKAAIHVEVPKGAVPVVVVDPVRNVAEVVAAPRANVAKKKQSWMDYLFGVQTY